MGGRGLCDPVRRRARRRPPDGAQGARSQAHDAFTPLRAHFGLSDAQRKDGGVSGPGLAWLLERCDVRAAAQASGFDADALDAFRLELVERLLGDVG
jgi:hypothetical protein